MKKSAERTEAKKAEIVRAALELFFEKGYEETSIRMIQKKIGREAGLFYYYFESKEVVFEEAINLFFASYEANMRAIVDEGRAAPKHTLTKYINYVQVATQSFREQYLKKLHWSILGAIREHTLQIMRKYVSEILNIYLKEGLIKQMAVDIEVAANLLAYGIGGSILYQKDEVYQAQKADIYCLIPLLLGIAEPHDEARG